jgi:shikimate dehydrogenase
MATEPYSLGLIGFPLGHSLSPRLHAAALEALHLLGEYRLYPVPPLPEGEAQLHSLLERLREGGLHGLNVTIPHKEGVLGLLDELTPTARAVGAVNTLINREGRLIGDNTDVEGFLVDLEHTLGMEVQFKKGVALVLGAGGAARAVVYALASAGWTVLVAARRPEQARALAYGLGPVAGGPGGVTEMIQPVPLVDLPATLISLPLSLNLIVNATPAGMAPAAAANPWPAGLAFPAGASVYDLVYNPPQSALVRSALGAGLAAVSGLGMLVEQAALAFELWTGKSPPRPALRAAVQLD